MTLKRCPYPLVKYFVIIGELLEDLYSREIEKKRIRYEEKSRNNFTKIKILTKKRK